MIGAVLLRYNGDPDSLAAAVQALLGSDAEPNPRVGDVLLVDNASTDDPAAVDRVAAAFTHLGADGTPLVRVLHRPSNDGFATGNNDAIANLRSSCDMVLIHNDDARLAPGALEVLHQALAIAPPDVVSVGPKTLISESASLIDSAGMAVNRNGEAKNVGLGQPDIGQFDGDQGVPYDVFGPCFAMALIRRSAFESSEVGPLASHYFLYYEDVEWNWRAQRLGFRSLLVPQAVAFHQMSSSSRSDSKSTADAERAYQFKHRYIERNLLATGMTHLPASNSVALWSHRWPRLVKGTVTGRFPAASGRAAVDALVGLPRTLMRRRAINRRSSVPATSPLRFWTEDPIFFDPVTYQPERSWRALAAAARGAGASMLEQACLRGDSAAATTAALAELQAEHARVVEHYVALIDA